MGEVKCRWQKACLTELLFYYQSAAGTTVLFIWKTGCFSFDNFIGPASSRNSRGRQLKLRRIYYKWLSFCFCSSISIFPRVYWVFSSSGFWRRAQKAFLFRVLFWKVFWKLLLIISNWLAKYNNKKLQYN